MGITLTKVAEWTSVDQSIGGKLEYTPINSKILKSILDFILDYSKSNQDGAQLVFEQPITWHSKIEPNQLGSKFRTYNNETVSEKEAENSEPIIRMNEVSTSEGKCQKISIINIEGIQEFLTLIGEDLQIPETRLILEENWNPVEKILGDRWATIQGEDNNVFRYIEEINDLDDDAKKKKKLKLKMALDFQNFDNNMLPTVLELMSENTRLTISMAEAQFNLMKMYVRSKEKESPIEYINPVSKYNFVHENGCRAPPWRQLHGDIAYFHVKLIDTDPFVLTANTAGWYFNQMNGAKTELEFEFKEDEANPGFERDLVQALKKVSPKCQEFVQTAQFRPNPQQRNAMARMMGDQTSSDMGNFADEEDNEAINGDKAGRSKAKQGKLRHQADGNATSNFSIRWEKLNIGHPHDHSEDLEFKDSQYYRKKDAQKQVTVEKTHYDSFSDTSSGSDEDEEVPDRRNENTDMSSEYWQIQKLVKYLKGGNQTSTIISLCALRDLPLHTENCQLAVRDVGGLEILINLLETDEVRCKIGALKILKEISKNPIIRRAIADLGGLQTMVNILKDPNQDLKCLSAETIANVAKFKRSRTIVRKHGGIRKLVALLDYETNGESVSVGKDAKDVAALNKHIDSRAIEVAQSGAMALWSCSKSTKCKQAMKRAGVISLLAKLLKNKHEDMLIPVVGTLQECASESNYRAAIRTEGMIEDLVKNLKSSNSELQMHCASTIFKCAEEKEIRDLVRQYDGLESLHKLLSQQNNKELLAAATGAIWKCSMSQENVKIFQKMKAIDELVALLNDQPEEVLVNVVGALGEMAKYPPNRAAMRKAGGITPLIHLLTGTNQELLINVTRAVGHSANEAENMAIIDKMDGVRLLWSLLKNPNPDVQSSAAWAICPCIENAKDAGEMVRSFVGGLELIVNLLKSDNIEILASVCAAIAKIAKDEENLAVITDHGVVSRLACLTTTKDDRLRSHLAEAIARCCSWGKNRVSFGEAGAVTPLVSYLRSKDPLVHRSTAQALFELSKHPDNCVSMHEACVVKLLLRLVGSEDEELQDAAAGCIANIRRLALSNEKSQQQKKQQANKGKK